MRKKLPAAVELGRRGGQATAKKLSKEQRLERARKAGKARWIKRQGLAGPETTTAAP